MHSPHEHNDWPLIMNTASIGTRSQTTTSIRPGHHDGVDSINPAATPQVMMPVLANSGQTLGHVAAVHQDVLTGHVTGLTVRFGFLGHKHTLVGIEDCGVISHDAVVLALSHPMFDRLPLRDAPVTRTLQPDLTWSR